MENGLLSEVAHKIGDREPVATVATVGSTAKIPTFKFVGGNITKTKRINKKKNKKNKKKKSRKRK